MNITQAKQYVLDTVRAYMLTDEDGMRVLDPRLQRPLFLIGPPGIGKTAIMAQVADELGIGLVSYSMTHHTRQSALGLPMIEHLEYNGFEYDASEYTMSEIIASIYEFMRNTGIEQGILFLDEVNCVSETLYPSMLQFLQFKTFGKHAVPDGWIIACAGNPAEYNRSVHEFDVATMDRIRKIEIEPDYESWRAYAANAHVHPAVTTFLETEQDLFYRVESTPSGKRFATARGWVDLSHMLDLNERLDVPVSQELVEQFVQDSEIAEKFSLYYELFRAYRSDYQVPSILDGSYPPEIMERAQNARLDERMALLGLLLDALVPEAEDVLLRDAVLTDVRDTLRAAKPILLEGAAADDVLAPEIASREAELARISATGAHDTTGLRKAKRALGILKDCRKACVLTRADAGESAFDVIHQEFRGHVGKLEADVTAFHAELANVYEFVDGAFGAGNEALLFTTELTARKPTARFISRFGSDAFAEHNQDLQTAVRQDDLERRIADALDERQSRKAAVAKAANDELEAYYETACWEYGYASLCHMALPSGLAGKTVLDIGCRRGKGVFRMSERVGERGHAIGVDWNEEHIAEAASRMDRAAFETGLSKNNMEFHAAYPEDLMAAGIGNETIDVVFVNSVLHLAYAPNEVLCEIHRVLKPGGLLVLEVALACAPRDGKVVQSARKLGNSVQAAPYRASFEEELERIGFDVEVVEEPKPVPANMGFKQGHEAPTAEGEPEMQFQALVLHARKRA